MDQKIFMVFDVESIGLHGEGFAFGWTVVDQDGNELDCGICSCPHQAACGRSADDREWVRKHIPFTSIPETHRGTSAVRRRFIQVWAHWRQEGATLWADCAFPVETRFIAQALDDDIINNDIFSPCPLHEIASVLLAKGYDPLAKYSRLPTESPEHNPMCDARQSARILLAALNGTLEAA